MDGSPKNNRAGSKVERQQPLLAVVEGVRGDATARSRGFVAAAVNVRELTVRFFWNGPVPTDVRDRIESTKTSSVKVEYRDVPYTLEQLTTEAQRILSSYKPAVTAGPNKDYTGLTIGVEADAASIESIEINSDFPIEVERRVVAFP